jgi:hypothetical protein
MKNEETTANWDEEKLQVTFTLQVNLANHGYV